MNHIPYGRLIQSSLRLNDDGSCFWYQWYLDIEYSDINTPILRQTCVSLNKALLLGINVGFIFGAQIKWILFLIEEKS